MSIFTPTQPQGIFAPCPDSDTYAQVTFSRPTRSYNSAGEIVLSVITTDTFTLDVQPQGGRFPRMIQGQVQQVDYELIGLGTLDIRIGDRCTLSGVLCEAGAVNHWGAHTEIFLLTLR